MKIKIMGAEGAYVFEGSNYARAIEFLDSKPLSVVVGYSVFVIRKTVRRVSAFTFYEMYH